MRRRISVPSQGSGTGGGAGTGTGTGVGPGSGSGVGPGYGGGFGGGAYQPGVNGVSMPEVISEKKPEYTSAAMRAKVQGTVEVEAIVNTDGTVTNARVVRSLDDRFGLDEKAIEAVRLWRFRPGSEGRPPGPGPRRHRTHVHSSLGRALGTRYGRPVFGSENGRHEVTGRLPVPNRDRVYRFARLHDVIDPAAVDAHRHVELVLQVGPRARRGGRDLRGGIERARDHHPDVLDVQLRRAIGRRSRPGEIRIQLLQLTTEERPHIV